jgi:hypothetical protein
MTVSVGLTVAVVAVAFRVLRLDSVPPGLYVDEVLTARNAFAWRLAAGADWFGSRPLLQMGWVETSNLYLAFVSTVLRLCGDGFVAVRLVSVLPSLAAVGLLYGLGREVAGPRAGALAAFLLGASHWAARTGRTGWDQVLMVALQLAALWLLARATRRGTALPGLFAGGLLGLSLHTYVASRLVVLHALGWQTWEALRRPESPEAARPGTLASATAAGPGRRAALVRLLLAALAAGLLAVPPFLRQPLDAGVGGGPRVGQLAAWSLSGPGEPWATLAESTIAHLAMFHGRGGAYARDALPGWPMLDPITGLLLLAGLVNVARMAGWRRRLLLSWPAVVVLGGVLSVSGEGPPYPYRVGGLAAWACLVAGIGGVHLWNVWAARRRRWAIAVATLALTAVVAVNGWVLFVAGPAYPGARRVYGTTETRVGLWLRDHRAGRPALVHREALRPPPPATGFPYARANRSNFFRPLDSIAAVQLAAGVYRQRPRRALDPLAAAGDVDLVARLPARVTVPAVVVVAPAQAAALTERWPESRRTDLRHTDGTALAVVLEIAPDR